MSVRPVVCESATSAIGVAMRVTVPRLTLVAIGAGATLCLTACSSTERLPTTRPALQSYSCCSSQDILAVHHPGEELRLHWIAVPARPSSRGAVSTVRLEASLSGPFASVSKLKSSGNSGDVTAPVVVTTDRVGVVPVSSILIPENAPAGSYNLAWSIDQDGGKVSAESVIQVSAKE